MWQKERGTKMQGRHSMLNVELLPSRLQRRVLCISTCRRSAAVLCIVCIARPSPPPPAALNVDSVISSSAAVASISHSPFSDKKIQMQIMNGTNQRLLVLKMEMWISIICSLVAVTTLLIPSVKIRKDRTFAESI